MHPIAEFVLWVLAVAGVVALVVLLVQSAFRTLFAYTELSLAEGLAEVTARRGDLTLLQERQRTEARARTTLRAQALWTAAALVWLLLPLLVGHARWVYALAAVLWLRRWFGRRGSAPLQTGS